MHPRLLVALFASALTAVAWLGPASTPAGERAWSAQLHVHGSFSEGVGSIDSHLAEAKAVGVDVVWWSDHDFRITSYRHVTTYGFDAEREPLDAGEDWTARGELEAGYKKGLQLRRFPPPRRGRGKSGVPDDGRSSATFGEEHAREGTPNLRLSHAAMGAMDFERMRGRFQAHRGLHHRPLASEITLRVWVLPFAHDGDGRAYVDLQLSEHSRQRSVPVRRYGVRYYLSNEDTEPWRVSGQLNVPLAFRAGEWNELVLPVTDDVVAGFPFIVGADNTLGAIEFGVEARAQAEPIAHFDELRIEQEIRGPAAYARQRELLEEVGRAHPGPQQHQGVEISWGSLHLNEFSVDTQLLDYDELLHESGLEEDDAAPFDDHVFGALVAQRALSAAHARGGLLSYNHMFGASMPGAEPEFSAEELLEELVATRLLGAELLEVGYRERGGRTLAEHLWVWDRLSERGLFPVGIGVSDSHGGPDARWNGAPNNFVTWIFAPTADKAALIEGLRRGRAFFGDRVLFDGELDLVTARGFRMGQIVLTDRDEASVEVSVRGLGELDELYVVDASGVVTRVRADGATQTAEHALGAVPGFVRAEIVDANREVKVVSNPIHILHEAPPGGIPAARAALDVDEVRSRVIAGFTLTGARAEQVEGRRALRIEGVARGGELHLDVPLHLTSPEVRFEGMSGSHVDLGGNLVLTELEGEGAVVLVGRRP
jgi:hypothetical protein